MPFLKPILPLAACLACAACVVAAPPPGYVAISDSVRSTLSADVALRQRAAEDCPLPTPGTFNNAIQLHPADGRPVPVTPAIRDEWVDGCAVIRFSVDAGGNVTQTEILQESVPGTGRPAADILRINRFANANSSDPYGPMVIRVAMAHLSNNATWVSIASR
jgi:hypothetical protein